MKKQEKLDMIQKAISDAVPCRCYFTYDENYYHYYPHAVTSKFLLGQEEDDFLLDGYCIRKLSQLKKWSFERISATRSTSFLVLPINCKRLT